ncbi:MAG: alanine:cation symporter family protein [Flavobacteriaceae bacterium]|nr:alanine:cation symporter family protein [Flavobacteriaceae bacterium]
MIEDLVSGFSSWIWDWPLLVLLIGGGLFFLFQSRFTPFLHFGHALNVLRGKYDDDKDEGEISHFQALSSAVAATVGMGNISGVAIAIVTGGPGAIFWMWITAFIGMATKFYTCTLAVMFRDNDEEGNTLSGPMYVITEGLGKKWKPLAAFFAIAGLVGTLPAFSANQLTQAIVDVFVYDEKMIDDAKLYIGIVVAILTAIVIFGGLKRIANVASRLVPFMVILYFLSVIYILYVQSEFVPEMFKLIFTDAFSGKAAAGGVLGYLILTAVKRAAFSNEAGIGTAPMMHGNAKTDEPVREGLVAMLGPAIDTILVCTLTALAILSTGVWKTGAENGISLTLKAFDHAIPFGIGSWILTLAIFVFAFSTMFSYSYYGTSCLGFLTKPKYGKYYNYIFVVAIVIASVVKLDFAINLIDSAFALMAIPTVLSAVLLSGHVNKAVKAYFSRLNSNRGA